MKAIRQYGLKPKDGAQVITAPEFFCPIHVGATQGWPTLYAEVFLDSPDHKHVFYVYSTGDDIPDNHRHVGSVTTCNGAFMWHVYESDEESTVAE